MMSRSLSTGTLSLLFEKSVLLGNAGILEELFLCLASWLCLEPCMPLTPLERDFLMRLSDQPWTSPPLFDHALVARLIEAGYVQTEVLPNGEVEYEITNDGRVALESA
jgi:hypothetical protein